MFQKKIGPKRNPNQGGINLSKRIKPAGSSRRKEFSEIKTPRLSPIKFINSKSIQKERIR